MKYLVLFVLVTSLGLAGCQDGGGSSSSSLPAPHPLSGIWLEQRSFVNSDQRDRTNTYLISIDDAGLVSEYNCLPSGGYALSAENMRMLDEMNETTFERKAFASEPEVINESFSLSDDLLLLEYSNSTFDMDRQLSYEMTRLSSFPTECEDNATLISGLSPMEFNADVDQTFDVEYSYRIIHEAQPEDIVSLRLQVAGRDQVGQPNGLFFEEYVVDPVETDGFLKTGSFTFSLPAGSNVPVGSLEFQLVIIYEYWKTPDLFVGEVSGSSHGYFIVSVNEE